MRPLAKALFIHSSAVLVLARVRGESKGGKRTADVVDAILDNEPVAVRIILVRADVGCGERLVGHFVCFRVLFELGVEKTNAGEIDPF